MLKRDKETGRLLKQPAKIGDWIVCDRNSPGFTPNKGYKIVATENSSEKNRVSFDKVYPLMENLRYGVKDSRFGVFVIDDDGDKRFVHLGADIFNVTWEKINVKSEKLK